MTLAVIGIQHHGKIVDGSLLRSAAQSVGKIVVNENLSPWFQKPESLFEKFPSLLLSVSMEKIAHHDQTKGFPLFKRVETKVGANGLNPFPICFIRINLPCSLNHLWEVQKNSRQ